MGELKRQDLIYKKEDLLISGLDKYREYNLYQMTGMAISAVFFFLGAYFTSTLKIIIYAGTIMMLFVFVVMLLNLSNAVQQHKLAQIKSSMRIDLGLISLVLLVGANYC